MCATADSSDGGKCYAIVDFYLMLRKIIAYSRFLLNFRKLALAEIHTKKLNHYLPLINNFFNLSNTTKLLLRSLCKCYFMFKANFKSFDFLAYCSVYWALIPYLFKRTSKLVPISAVHCLFLLEENRFFIQN